MAGYLERAELVNARRWNRPRSRPGFGPRARPRPGRGHNSIGRDGMMPMRFIDNDQPGGPARGDHSAKEEQRENRAFHVWLDRKPREILPRKKACAKTNPRRGIEWVLVTTAPGTLQYSSDIWTPPCSGLPISFCRLES